MSEIYCSNEPAIHFILYYHLNYKLFVKNKLICFDFFNTQGLARKDVFSMVDEISPMAADIYLVFPIGPCGEIKDCNKRCIELKYLNGGSCVKSSSGDTCICEV